jgi:hypothetical protein
MSNPVYRRESKTLTNPHVVGRCSKKIRGQTLAPNAAMHLLGLCGISNVGEKYERREPRVGGAK